MKIQHSSLLIIGALACLSVVAQPADIILTQGKIISADAQNKIYQAMAVRDGKIIALGKSKDIQAWKGKQTQVIDLKGKRGSLEIGKLADLAVLSDDYLNVPLEKMAQIYSQLTMVGGNIVYREGLK